MTPNITDEELKRLRECEAIVNAIFPAIQKNKDRNKHVLIGDTLLSGKEADRILAAADPRSTVDGEQP